MKGICTTLNFNSAPVCLKEAHSPPAASLCHGCWGYYNTTHRRLDIKLDAFSSMKKWLKLSGALLAPHVCPLLAPGADSSDKQLTRQKAIGWKYVTEIN